MSPGASLSGNMLLTVVNECKKQFVAKNYAPEGDGATISVDDIVEKRQLIKKCQETIDICDRFFDLRCQDQLLVDPLCYNRKTRQSSVIKGDKRSNVKSMNAADVIRNAPPSAIKSKNDDKENQNSAQRRTKCAW